MSHTKYDHYKKSNIYWVGNIPSHWETIPVKHHFFSNKQVAGNLADNYQRLALTLNGVIKRSKEDAEGLQPEMFETYQIVRKNSLIFKLIDLENIKTSRVGLSKWEGLVSPAYIILSSNGDILSSYAEKYFLNMWHEHIFNQLGSVGVRSNLNKEDVLNLPIIKPPLNEQQQIANYLDKQTAKIDATIAKNEELIELLEEKRVALINQVVTKGLNPDVPMKDSGVEWIGEIPEHWNVINLKHIANLQTGTTPSKNIGITQDKGINWFTPGDFDNTFKLNYSNKYITDDAIKTNNIKIYPPFSILMVCIGATIGKLGATNDFSYSNQQITAILPKLRVNYKYLLYYLISKTDYIKETANFTTLPILNNQHLSSFTITQPPEEEQKQIGNHLDYENTKINSIITKIKENISLLEEYKTSLIHHVVTGKIDVRGEEI